MVPVQGREARSEAPEVPSFGAVIGSRRDFCRIQAKNTPRLAFYTERARNRRPNRPSKTPLPENPCLKNPCLKNPCLKNPCLKNPCLENHCLENPCLENHCLVAVNKHAVGQVKADGSGQYDGFEVPAGASEVGQAVPV
jgi:hypothetical protein